MVIRMRNIIPIPFSPTSMAPYPHHPLTVATHPPAEIRRTRRVVEYLNLLPDLPLLPELPHPLSLLAMPLNLGHRLRRRQLLPRRPLALHPNSNRRHSLPHRQHHLRRRLRNGERRAQQLHRLPQLRRSRRRSLHHLQCRNGQRRRKKTVVPLGSTLRRRVMKTLFRHGHNRYLRTAIGTT